MKTLEKPKPGRLIKSKREASPRYTPKTHLGKKLWALRQNCIAGHTHLLDWDQLEKEVARGKGQAD